MMLLQKMKLTEFKYPVFTGNRGERVTISLDQRGSNSKGKRRQ